MRLSQFRKSTDNASPIKQRGNKTLIQTVSQGIRQNIGARFAAEAKAKKEKEERERVHKIFANMLQSYMANHDISM
jgi:hypothetical protein